MDANRTEEELKRVRNELQTVLDNVPAYIYQIDASGRYLFANRGYLNLINQSLDNLVGRHVTEVFSEEEARSFMENNRAILESGQTSEFTESAELADGRHVYSSVKTPLFDSSGKAAAILGISTDITERVRTEQALKESDRRKDEFLAILGHELRNPLAPLSMGIELLKQANGKPGSVESVRGMMKRQLAHLTRLVDDLVDVARISRGRIQLQRRQVDLNAVLDSAIDQVRSLIRARKHGLVEERTRAPLPVNGDAERLTQVMVNLLTNSAKYMEEGGTITLRTETDDGQAVVTVQDTGYGIPKEDLASIFQMFKQVGEHQKRTGGSGLGIGLSLCRQLLEMHNGTIEAHSAGIDRGTEFIVRLPLTEASFETTPSPSGEGHGESRRILIVDDNVDAASSLGQVLKLRGHRVRIAAEGSAALDCVKDFEPDIILLDIGLPGIDGYEVGRRIRASPEGRSAALYALTGRGQEKDKQRSRDAGFDAHLTKPVDIALLSDLIASGRTGILSSNT